MRVFLPRPLPLTLPLPEGEDGCERIPGTASDRHPGRLERVRVLHRGAGYYVRIETREGADREWLQIWSLASGLVVSEQRLIDILP